MAGYYDRLRRIKADEVIRDRRLAMCNMIVRPSVTSVTSQGKANTGDVVDAVLQHLEVKVQSALRKEGEGTKRGAELKKLLRDVRRALYPKPLSTTYKGATRR
jgi:hypothetical protein